MDVRKHSFSQRTVHEWNNLSADGVHSSSIDMFKNRIDNYLIRTGYMWTLDKDIDMHAKIQRMLSQQLNSFQGLEILATTKD